jgi:hypothetical protein
MHLFRRAPWRGVVRELHATACGFGLARTTLHRVASPVASTFVKRGAHRAAPGVLPEGCTPSDEQLKVLNSAERGCNILCRAVAGAGKTLTLLLCAERTPNEKHLLLTYSKHLQLDVAKRAQGENVTAMTYHAAAGKMYTATIHNDTLFDKYIMDRNARRTPLVFDVLCLDEAQDMTPSFHAFVCSLLADNPHTRMIVTGDELQAVHEYRGAHSGFLTDAPRLYREFMPAREWESCRLGVSQRLTPANADFVNNHLYNSPPGTQVIIGGNKRSPNRPPIYHAVENASPKTLAIALNRAINLAIAEFGIDDVVVLANSLNNLGERLKMTPLGLWNRDYRGEEVYVNVNKSDFIGSRGRDKSLSRGKLDLTTFVGSKGCERSCVILVSFDETYFKFYDKGWDDTPRDGLLPNVLTVAATRAKSQLVVIAAQDETLRTVQPNLFCGSGSEASVDVRGTADNPRHEKSPAFTSSKYKKCVTELLRHLHPATKRTAMSYVATTAFVDIVSRDCPSFNGKVEFKHSDKNTSSDTVLTEDLSFLYGEIPIVLAEVARTGTTKYDYSAACAIRTTKDSANWPLAFRERLADALAINRTKRTPTDWAVIGVARSAVENGDHHLTRQIAHFDWVEEKALIACRDIVLRALDDVDGDFEVKMPIKEIDNLQIEGIADFVEKCTASSSSTSDERVWEFKLNELSEEDELQLACYLALCGGGTGILMSIRRADRRRVVMRAEDATPFLIALAKSNPIVAKSLDTVIAEFDAEVVRTSEGKPKSTK